MVPSCPLDRSLLLKYINTSRQTISLKSTASKASCLMGFHFNKAMKQDYDIDDRLDGPDTMAPAPADLTFFLSLSFPSPPFTGGTIWAECTMECGLGASLMVALWILWTIWGMEAVGAVGCEDLDFPRLFVVGAAVRGRWERWPEWMTDQSPIARSFSCTTSKVVVSVRASSFHSSLFLTVLVVKWRKSERPFATILWHLVTFGRGFFVSKGTS